MDALTPDAEPALGRFLRSHAAITAIVGTRSSTALSGTYPAIRYRLVSGDMGTAGVAVPRLQIECWADDEDTVSFLARTVVAAVPDMVGAITDGTVAGVSVDYPFSSDDAATGRRRLIVQIRLLTHPPV